MKTFMINYRISGTATSIIEAEDLASANDRINEEINKDDFECDLDDIDDVDFSIYELISVERDGKRIKTNYVKPTDKVL